MEPHPVAPPLTRGLDRPAAVKAKVVQHQMDDSRPSRGPLHQMVDQRDEQGTRLPRSFDPGQPSAGGVQRSGQITLRVLARREHRLLLPNYRDSGEAEQRKRRNWQEAFLQVAGESAVLTGEGTVDQLERKGYTPVKAPEGIVNAAARYGVQTPAKVLSSDEMSGRLENEPTDSAQAAVDFVWSVIERHGLDNGKAKPPVRCFTSILDGGVMLNGNYRDGVVFINSDLAPAGAVEVCNLSNRLLKVALEECSHFSTGATDNSRDFQVYLLELAVKMNRARIEEMSSSA